MSSVRLKLPGAIFFVSNLYSLLTGLAFTVIVTRTLTIDEFGLWSMLSQYIAYTAIPLSNIASFWIVRYAARGFRQAPVSGLLFGMILSLIGTPIYLAVVLGASISFSQPLFILLLATPQVATYIMWGALSGIAMGISPEHIGLSSVIFETSKVVFAYVLVRMLGQGLAGAIVSVIIAQIIQLAYLLTIPRGFISSALVDKGLIKKWFKLSWFPFYEFFGGIVSGIDVIVARIISMNDALIGIRSVACIAGSFPRYASSLTLSLYPRTLGVFDSDSWSRDVEEMLKFLGFIAIPITFGNIALMDIMLGIFGRSYTPAVAAAVVMSIAQLVGLIGAITDPVIKGSEQVDLQNNAGLKSYLKGVLFKLVTVNNLSAVAYVVAVAIALMLWRGGDMYIAALYWNIASFISIPFLVYKVKMMQDIGVRLRVPILRLIKYFALSVLMFVFILMFKNTLRSYFVESVFGLISMAVILTLLGALFYIGLALIADDYARKISKESVRSLKLRLFASKREGC